ncbi:MAG: bifunctional phosphoribosylaminoimidazolecarboxamide formyltransferase/IMP cyclohydrolase, partial [Gaiellaceae bacterium]
MIDRALISVFDKTGLDVFARGLNDLGVEIVASGGTAAYVAELGIDVVPVEELTDVPELLGGRVKTLHPRIHAGILARRGLEADLDELRDQGIRTFDLVCVNLYPFQTVAGRRNVREEEAVEMIDIGGPALLRAAAKNFVDVVPVCDPGRYERILAQLAGGDGVGLDQRRQLAAEAFAHTAAYEA